MSIFDLLPRKVPPDSITACIGLLSDTHIPQRCTALPGALRTVFEGAQFLLHAGDVGELWVLEELSQIAPVIAVHGNDETTSAKFKLPSQQLISIAGQRLVLCHSHYPGRVDEVAFRGNDSWQPKQAGASILVYGHSHIPMDGKYGSVRLINPGAIAAGSAVSRQRIQTVGLLFFRDGKPPIVVHVDLAAPLRPHRPAIDLAVGFSDALRRYSASILDRDLAAVWPALNQQLLEFHDDWAGQADVDTFYEALLRIAHRCWAGEKVAITCADLCSMVAFLGRTGYIRDTVAAKLMAALEC